MSTSFSVRLKDLVTQQAFNIQLAIDSVTQSVINAQSKIQIFSSSSTRSLNSLNNQLSLQKAARSSTTNIAQFIRLSSAIKRTERDIRRLENLPSTGFISRIGQAGSKMVGLVSITNRYNPAAVAVGAINNMANLGIEAEQSRIKFEGLLGSSEKANALMSNLTDYGIKSPYDSADLTKAIKSGHDH